jgi:hypothetical protein
MAGSPCWQEFLGGACLFRHQSENDSMIASGREMMARSGAAPLILSGESALLPDFLNYPPDCGTVQHAGAAL